MAQPGQPIVSVQVIAGPPALVDFVRERLRAGLATAGFNAAGLSAREVFIAAFDKIPNAGARARLAALLGVAYEQLSDNAADSVFVVPRLGTVSPWSTQAEDIARNIGLSTLVRLERGMAFTFDTAPDFKALVASHVLHDPMTQSILPTRQRLPRVFDWPARRGLRRVPLATHGVAALHKANREWGLALADGEIAYLEQQYRILERDPTDVELMMFAQINS